MTKPHLLSIATTLAAALILGVALPAQAQAVKAGDAAAGAMKVQMCIGCHSIPGYQASFPEIYKVPKIAGQNAAYIVSALTSYKKGDRKHPSMRAIATSLSDQDMADVAAYYSQLAKADPVPAQATEPSAMVAQLIAQSGCTACHGANFSSPSDPAFPKLAGQHADYLYVALKSYQTDHNPLVGRNNAIMMGMAGKLTHPEIKALASYLSSLPSELKTVEQGHFR
jgi:cytochrome c553